MAHGVLHQSECFKTLRNLLSPVRAGIGVDFMLNNVGIEYEFWYNDPNIGSGSIPIVIQVEQIGLASRQPNFGVRWYFDVVSLRCRPNDGIHRFIFDGTNASILEWIYKMVGGS